MKAFMKIEFNHIEPHNLLKPYIDKMWVFKCSGKLPSDDLKLVVPNGNIKLSIFSINGITASVKGKSVTSKEGSINLTGLVDVPLSLDTEKDIFTQTIGIELILKEPIVFFNLILVKSKIKFINSMM